MFWPAEFWRCNLKRVKYQVRKSSGERSDTLATPRREAAKRHTTVQEGVSTRPLDVIQQDVGTFSSLVTGNRNWIF